MESLTDILEQDEVEIAQWTPSIWMFLRRFVFVGLITSIVLGAVTYPYGFTIWLATTGLGIAVYGFIFDDYTIWLERRFDLWVLTNRRLIYVDDHDYYNALSVPLGEIENLSTGFWGSILVGLGNRQKVTMPYLANRKSAQDHISRAIKDTKGT